MANTAHSTTLIGQAIIKDNSMSPRVVKGETVLYDTNRNDKGRGLVIATIKHASGRSINYVKNLVKFDGAEIILSQTNPCREISFQREQVVSVHPITFITSTI